jgi:hypothetical protein
VLNHSPGSSSIRARWETQGCLSRVPCAGSCGLQLPHQMHQRPALQDAGNNPLCHIVVVPQSDGPRIEPGPGVVEHSEIQSKRSNPNARGQLGDLMEAAPSPPELVSCFLPSRDSFKDDDDDDKAFWYIWCGFCSPPRDEPTQAAPLTNRVSNRARQNQGSGYIVQRHLKQILVHLVLYFWPSRKRLKQIVISRNERTNHNNSRSILT